jgi:hypothetical protein
MLISQTHSWQKILLLFLSAFIIRSSVFYFYVQHEERYCQSDSLDYHVAAVGIAHGTGMHRFDNNEPLFWRTPGYPAYLALFYYIYGLKSPQFIDNMPAQKTSIWIQIFLCSFIPILIFLLSLIVTQSLAVSWIAAWISVFHVGFVLASCYILTDALAMLLFLLFLISFFYVLTHKKIALKKTIYLVLLGSLMLAGFTWMRPMGQFIAIAATIFIFFMPLKFKQKIITSLIFLSCFFALISPWYIRNYNLTGSVFFCPLFGPYLTVFSAPKIKARIDNISLLESHKILSYQGGKAAYEDMIEAQKKGTKKPSKELSALKVALPWIFNYPHYFIYDWLTEVIKTTFDLYSSQLVAFAAHSFKWDPLIEYLPEKIAACLYTQSMPLFMRLICLIEFIFALLLWIGLFFGIIQFIFKPLIKNTIQDSSKNNLPNFKIWVCAAILSIITVGMTGGFGYGRLRLPIEPLMIILTIQSWLYIEQTYQIKNILINMRNNVKNRCKQALLYKSF